VQKTKLTTWRDLFSEMLDMTQEQLDSQLFYYDEEDDCYVALKMTKNQNRLCPAFQNSNLLILREGVRKCKSQA
jgi:hypothetical protein